MEVSEVIFKSEQQQINQEHAQILLICFSLLIERGSQGRWCPLARARAGGREDSGSVRGPQGSWHREASLSTPLTWPDVYQ